MDVRWNTAHDSFTRAVEMREFITAAETAYLADGADATTKEAFDKNRLTPQEWTLLDLAGGLLQQFKRFTVAVQSEREPTLHLVLPWMEQMTAPPDPSKPFNANNHPLYRDPDADEYNEDFEEVKKAILKRLKMVSY